MGKEKENMQAMYNDGLSFGESIDVAFNEFKMAAFTADDIAKIDWTKVKPIIGKLWESFGPIFIQLLLSYMGKLPITPPIAKE